MYGVSHSIDAACGNTMTAGEPTPGTSGRTEFAARPPQDHRTHLRRDGLLITVMGITHYGRTKCP
jgi:hypothetical protein